MKTVIIILAILVVVLAGALYLCRKGYELHKKGNNDDFTKHTGA